jgi:hypothetical protein
MLEIDLAAEDCFGRTCHEDWLVSIRHQDPQWATWQLYLDRLVSLCPTCFDRCYCGRAGTCSACFGEAGASFEDGQLDELRAYHSGEADVGTVSESRMCAETRTQRRSSFTDVIEGDCVRITHRYAAQLDARAVDFEGYVEQRCGCIALNWNRGGL